MVLPPMRDACHRHLFNREECTPCQRIAKRKKMSRLKRSFLRVRSAMWPDQPYFGDHDPDSWYMKPATLGFQQAAWLFFAFVGLTILFMEISQQGIWLK